MSSIILGIFGPVIALSFFGLHRGWLFDKQEHERVAENYRDISEQNSNFPPP
jgi:hypothetical protein